MKGMSKMEKKLAALTFDDGPNTVTTPKILDVLEKYHVPATFFLVGNSITDASAAVSKRAFEMGCEIENHSRTHSAFPELTAEEMSAEICFTSEKIKDITGKYPKFFRPPYIALNDLMYSTVPLFFICGKGCNDWDDAVSADERFNVTMSQVCHGDIILLHDMEGNDKTVEAVDRLIPALWEQGYELVTVEQLFERCNVQPRGNVIYTNVND